MIINDIVVLQKPKQQSSGKYSL